MLEATTGDVSCDKPTRHKDLFVDPRVVRKAGIPVHAAIQRPGDNIFTFPAAHHQGFNTGPNLNIAVNYARLAWIPDVTARVECTCNRERFSNESAMKFICGFVPSDLDCRVIPTAEWEAQPRDDRLKWEKRDLELAASKRSTARVEAGLAFRPNKRLITRWGQLKRV